MVRAVDKLEFRLVIKKYKTNTKKYLLKKS